MPVMNGIDCTKKIRSVLTKKDNIANKPKIIGLTGHVQEKFIKEGIKAGMDDVFAKPLYINVLK
jgi:CheY-like chemotaxis protein